MHTPRAHRPTNPIKKLTDPHYPFHVHRTPQPTNQLVSDRRRRKHLKCVPLRGGGDFCAVSHVDNQFLFDAGRRWKCPRLGTRYLHGGMFTVGNLVLSMRARANQLNLHLRRSSTCARPPPRLGGLSRLFSALGSSPVLRHAARSGQSHRLYWRQFSLHEPRMVRSSTESVTRLFNPDDKTRSDVLSITGVWTASRPGGALVMDVGRTKHIFCPLYLACHHDRF